MLIFNGTEVSDVKFNDIIIDTIVMDDITVYSAKQAYTPTHISRTVSPYGETIQIQIEAPQDGGEYDIDNISMTGEVPISDLVLSTYNNILSFKTNACNKGLISNINVPVIGCKKYYDYGIPIILDSCNHPSNKLTYHSGSSATCTESGVAAYYTCSCDAANHTLNSAGNEISTYIAPLGHNSSSTSTASIHLKSSASCTSPAYYYYSCSRCGTNSTSSFSSGSALGHSFTQDKIWSESRQLRTSATCTAAATYWRECDRCTTHSTSQYFSSGSALGHDYSSTSTSSSHLKSAATCTSAASYYYSCTRCGANSSSTFTSGSSLGHDYVNYKCTRCSNIKAVTITSQPSNVSGAAGTTQHCTVTADGYSLTYKWYYKDSAASSYKSSTTQSSNKLYRTLDVSQFPSKKILAYCIITDGYGNSVTTRTVTFTIT